MDFLSGPLFFVSALSNCGKVSNDRNDRNSLEGESTFTVSDEQMKRKTKKIDESVVKIKKNELFSMLRIEMRAKDGKDEIIRQ